MQIEKEQASQNAKMYRMICLLRCHKNDIIYFAYPTRISKVQSLIKTTIHSLPFGLVVQLNSRWVVCTTSTCFAFCTLVSQLRCLARTRKDPIDSICTVPLFHENLYEKGLRAVHLPVVTCERQASNESSYNNSSTLYWRRKHDICVISSQRWIRPCGRRRLITENRCKKNCVETLSTLAFLKRSPS